MTDPKRNDPRDGWQCPHCSAHRRECWYCGTGKEKKDNVSL
jgi:hypothetical protein